MLHKKEYKKNLYESLSAGKAYEELPSALKCKAIINQNREFMKEFFELEGLGDVLKDGNPAVGIVIVALGAFWALAKFGGK